MVTKAEANKANINLLTVFISFLTCLFLLFLILELTSRLFSSNVPLHSVTAPVQISGVELVPDEIDGALEDVSSLPVSKPATFFSKNKITPPAISQKVRAVYSLVILDYGLSNSQSKAIAEKLPEFTTISLSPYTVNKDEVLSYIDNNDMELWGFIETPSTNGYIQTTGPLSISPALTNEVKAARLDRLLIEAKNLTGFIMNNDEFDIGSPFTSKGYGYYNLGDKAIPTLLYNRYNQVLMDKARLKIFLNEVFDRSNGIIAVEPSPALIEALPDLLDSFMQAGLQIVPLSYFVDQQ